MPSSAESPTFLAFKTEPYEELSPHFFREINAQVATDAQFNGPSPNSPHHLSVSCSSECNPSDQEQLPEDSHEQEDHGHAKQAKTDAKRDAKDEARHDGKIAAGETQGGRQRLQLSESGWSEIASTEVEVMAISLETTTAIEHPKRRGEISTILERYNFLVPNERQGAHFYNVPILLIKETRTSATSNKGSSDSHFSPAGHRKRDRIGKFETEQSPHPG